MGVKGDMDERLGAAKKCAQLRFNVLHNAVALREGAIVKVVVVPLLGHFHCAIPDVSF